MKNQIKNLTVEISDISEMARDVAERVKSGLTVNDMPIDEFIMNVYEVAHYLEAEIQNTENIRPTDAYGGVKVGFEESAELRKRHIWFCKHIMGLLGINGGNHGN